MYVIRGNTPAIGTGAGAIPISTGRIFPADDCTWQFSYDDTTGQYTISGAWYLPPNDVRTPIAAPELGYIGKSGRFVRIAD